MRQHAFLVFCPSFLSTGVFGCVGTQAVQPGGSRGFDVKDELDVGKDKFIPPQAVFADIEVRVAPEKSPRIDEQSWPLSGMGISEGVF